MLAEGLSSCAKGEGTPPKRNLSREVEKLKRIYSSKEHAAKEDAGRKQAGEKQRATVAHEHCCQLIRATASLFQNSLFREKQNFPQKLLRQHLEA